MKKEKRIPTIFGLLFLVLTIFAGVFITRQNTSTGVKASGDCNPVSPQITNVTGKSASVSFSTNDSCTVTVIVANQTINDFQAKGKLHYFQIYNLSPNTSYPFVVVGNGQKINKSSYIIKTGGQPSSLATEAKLAWGKVVNSEKRAVKGVIVYLNIPGAAPLSAITTSEGNWNIPLANSYNESRTDWFSLPTTAVSEDLIAISEDGIITQLTNTTDQNNPVPDITIGQDYFSSQNAPTPTTSTTSSFGAFPTSTQSTVSKNIDISNPKENENLSTGLPDFFGVAPANSKVIISVHSSVEVYGESQSDSTGLWHWSPTQTLEPGTHTITAKVLDPVSGVWQTITRNFVVQAASGSSQVAFTASASATLAPTSIPTPTSTPTLVPTVRVSHPSTSSGVPESGISLPTFLMVILAGGLFLLSYRFLK